MLDFESAQVDTERVELVLQDIATLGTFNKELGELKDAAIYVKGNVIEWVGKSADLPSAYETADTVVSLSEHVVIPGIVNTHHHMFQCITRCVAQVRNHVVLLDSCRGQICCKLTQLGVCLLCVSFHFLTL